MLFKYKPSSLFRGISNERLKAIFDRVGITLDVDWEKRDPKSDTTVADKWAEYKVPEDKRSAYNTLQMVFQRIYIIANSRTNALAFIKKQEAFNNIGKLPKDFDDEGKWSKAERGAYIYLEESPDKLKEISEILFASDISYSDHMVDYQCDRLSFTISEEIKERLKTAISDFYKVPMEDRETLVKIESYPMAGTEQNYFFYTKDGDTENMELRLETDPAIELKQIHRPYTIVFTCDNNHMIKSTAGKSEDTEDEQDEDTDSGENAAANKKGKPGTLLSIYAKDIGAKKRDELARCIIEALGGEAPKRAEKATYLLDCFADPGYKFPAMNDHGINECHAKRIGIITAANPDDELIFTNLQKHNVYDTMRRSFQWCRAQDSEVNSSVEDVFEQPFSVTLISITMTPRNGKPISFDLRKHSCNRHNYPEDICEVIQVLIDRMGIEV